MATQLESATGSKLKLIEATIELISSRGFESTGITEILQTANVTKSNFYYHFKSKEALCLAALDGMTTFYIYHVIKPTMGDKSLSSRKRFENFFQRALERMEANGCNRGCPFVNLAMETSDYYPAFREKLDKFFRIYTRLIKDCFIDGVKNGEFRNDLDSEQVAQFILSCFNGTMVLSKSRKTTDVIRQNAEIFFKLIEKP